MVHRMAHVIGPFFAGGVCAGLLLALAAVPAATAGPAVDAAPIVFVASEGNSPPLDIFDHGNLSGGIVRDIGEAIAGKLGVSATFVTLPRKRVEAALASGEADALCYASPDWYRRGDLKWSAPIIPNAEVVLTRAGIEPVTNLNQLRGRKVGTVLGYVYPDVDSVIGSSYERDEAPRVAVSIRKLKAGRFDYAIVDQLTLDYEARDDAELRKLPTMVVSQVKGQCAFSPKSRFSFETFSRTVDGLIQDGTVDRILARYR